MKNRSNRLFNRILETWHNDKELSHFFINIRQEAQHIERKLTLNAKDWSTWPGHPKYGNVPEIIRLEMLEREAVAREALKKSIKERLQSIENNS
ncbi:hypothetical protein ACS94_05900 [Bacillus cereus]|uniref:DUF3958 domain-containing protein n=1 Tax=Bacillus cereus VD184 TaxID=1053242 RepID=A0A9W5VTL3_BACCE|nr:hypothetical protein FORC5_1752 [Bacillus cereus]EOQ16503.1 hypothetical protein IKC_04426 [Bacillus cereus VD184]KAB7681912.1 DUF3958 domain-containing protein [Bacillus sp. B1-WWTP-T-0.5-Post-4]OFC87499.1 hypothetical protein BTGOE3_17750 [Bacillus thuringiensis]QEL68208.1 DUF3958 domain-containing protein [Bacillus sp. AR4-2]QEL73486.1 DUF3958 domain-containing protein [Bacillus sp. SH8-8]CCW05099.1 hypothetical protein EBGED10_18210 [Bacillus sp. GeD10]HCX49750.1 DUF3958 domain-contai